MHGEYKTPGGKLVVVDFIVHDGRLADVEVTGDFFLYPDDALDTIIAALNGLPPAFPRTKSPPTSSTPSALMSPSSASPRSDRDRDPASNERRRAMSNERSRQHHSGQTRQQAVSRATQSNPSTQS